VPASSFLSEKVKQKMHYAPKPSDYCCRSLNVNHVTDAQIERRFKEVSPVVLAQAYNLDSRMYWQNEGDIHDTCAQADVDGSGAIDFAEFYGLWFSLTRPNEVTLQEVKDILRKR